jgi:hypothetical protein
MSIDDGSKKSFIGNIWLIYGDKIVLAIGIILIAAVSFEAGFLQGSKKKQEPIAINKVANSEISDNKKCQTDPAANNANNSSENNKSATSENTTPPSDNQKCAFVASKNSNKYHLPTCQFAQKIKPENKICFSSVEEAEKRGYVGAKCCIK